MKKTYTIEDFIEIFKDHYTHNALIALYEYLNQLAYDLKTEIDIEDEKESIIERYVEYKTAWEAMYSIRPDDMPTIEIADNENPDLIELQEKEEQLALEWLEDNQLIITFDGGLILENNV